MSTQVLLRSKYGSAYRRWAGVGPYYAMFPIAFAERVIRQYTDVGDVVLDPFSGRGTAVFVAAAHDRAGIGIEINPVGYVYTKAKLKPANRKAVEKRIVELGKNAWRYRQAADELPIFFHHCYSQRTREFLLIARSWLNWQSSFVDCTTLALLLVHLHGKRTDSLSNQMRQTKSLSPQYAVHWWTERGMEPPDIDPVEFMRKKLKWRYAKGIPTLRDSRVYLGDSVKVLQKVQKRLALLGTEKAKLLLTSPPYCGVTNYHYDQWLRLWLLGGSPAPTAPVGPHQGKFVDRAKYKKLLQDVFMASRKLLAKDAVVYVRTDSRLITRKTTKEALATAFPEKRMRTRIQRLRGPTQTELFGGESNDEGEVDIVLN
jgi:hypothetical protein